MKLPHVPAALQQAVIHSLRTHLRQANHYLAKNYPEPEITYQQRGTQAGTAWLERGQIRLNAILLLENQQAFIDEVIPHELAHLLVWQHFGRVAPHGKEWCWMMEQVLNITAHRTHGFSVASVQGKTFAYHCGCQRHQLSLRRHNRILRQQAEYRCKHCQQRLIPDKP